MKTQKLNKKAIIICCIVITTTQLFSQIGIGVSGAVNSSAALEVTSSTKGLLPPRMITSDRDLISTPANGLIIYNSTSNKLNVYENGYWSEMSTNTQNEIISGNKTNSGTSTFTGEVTMNAHMMLPMAELCMYSSGKTTRLTNTSWNGVSTASTGWANVVFNSIGSTVGSNTIADSIAGMRLNPSVTLGVGSMKYTSVVSKHFYISLSFSYNGSSSSGNSMNELAFGIFKVSAGGTAALLPESVIIFPNSTTINSSAMHAMTMLAPGESIDFRVIGINGSSSSDVGIRSINFFAMGL